MVAGVLEDLAGNNHTGIAESSYYFDVADSSFPIVLSALPAHAATDQPNNVTIFIQFDEHIQLDQSGSIYLYPSGGNSANEGVEIPQDTNGAPNPEISLSDNHTLKIDYSANVDDRGGKRCSVSIPSGLVRDFHGNHFGGFDATASDSSLHNYYFEVTDSTSPDILSLAPPNDGVDVNSHEIQRSGIRFEFNEYVTMGSGNITLTPFGGNNENVEFEIQVPSSEMSCSNAVHSHP